MAPGTRGGILGVVTVESMTTIKIPKQLRERVARDAAEQGLTAAGFIATLIDDYERRRRFDAVRRAYASTDPSYVDETKAWDALAGDGIDT